RPVPLQPATAALRATFPVRQENRPVRAQTDQRARSCQPARPLCIFVAVSSAPWRFVPLPRFLLRAPLLPLPPFGAAARRRLLADPAVRPQVRLRRAPSLLRGPDRARWLAFGVPFGEEREAEIDARLARILDASDRWIAWPALRAVAGSASDRRGAGDADADA